CEKLVISMIEQPVPAHDDEVLRNVVTKIPLCADEAAHVSDDLDGLMGKYQMINIKLDKTGGLTHAWHMKQAAQARGFAIMVGCMLATSLAMAPAMLLVDDDAIIADLDGPLLLAKDRPHGLKTKAGKFLPAQPELWG
ncbi:MAG: enolase C-terminal domain-like protein, partial [Pseudomonadota bacterium]